MVSAHFFDLRNDIAKYEMFGSIGLKRKLIYPHVIFYLQLVSMVIPWANLVSELQ